MFILLNTFINRSFQIFISIVILIIYSTPVISQNFNGGKYDGYFSSSSTNYSSNLLSKFAGGKDDGYNSSASTNFSLSLVSKFAGGKNDGYSSELGVFQLIGEKTVVFINQPDDRSLTGDQIIEVAGTAEDDNIVTIVQLKLNDGEWMEVDNSELKLINWSVNISLSPGENTIQARATDNNSQFSDIFQITVWYISPPENLTASDATSNDNVEILWNSSCGIHPVFANYYKVYRSESNDSGHAVEISNWITNNFYYDETAHPGKDYWYFIKQKVNITESALSIGNKGVREVFLDISGEHIYNVGNNDGNFDVIFSTNASWTAASSVSWLSVSPQNGNANSSVNIVYVRNDTWEQRTGKIIIIAGGILSDSITVNQEPSDEIIANFSASSGLISQGESVDFLDLSHGNPTSWEWDFDNDGTIDSYLQNPSWLYSEPGIYSIYLFVSNDNYNDTELKENFIEVIPVWTVNPPDFAFDGDIMTEVFIDDIPVTEGGILAAFAGEECRGVMHGGMTGPTGKYLFLLRCYSNQATGETLNFRFYDSEYGRVFDISEQINFESNMIIGNALNPFFMHAYTSIEINIPLSQGWTWFSLNVNSENMNIDEVLTSLILTENDYIKNQTVSATYYDDFNWVGDLTAFNNTEMYKIRLDQSNSLDYTGYIVEPANNPISIDAGWNWAAYIPQYPLSLPNALSSLNIQSFDYIKNQRFSSTYYDGYGWFGDLIDLFPNDGYMIKITEPGTLTYPPPEQIIHLKPPDEIVEITEKIPFYNIESSQFEHTGSITAEVFINGYNSGSSENLLYAFTENMCRGAAQGLLFPPTGNYVYNLMVFSNSNSGEEFSFRFYNSEEEQWYEFDETLKFESDMIEADAYNPFELKIGSAMNVNWINNNSFNLEIFPNPFRDLLQINFSTSVNQNIYISLYDNYGRKLNIIESRAYQPGSYNIEWNCNNLSNGVYFIRLEAKGFVENKKLIKVK